MPQAPGFNSLGLPTPTLDDLMSLSQKTIDEMKAGMRQVASHAGRNGVDPEYMDAMIRTGIRAKWLHTLEKEGRVKIEKRLRGNTGGEKTHGDACTYVVHVGANQFEDINAQITGCWPSEVLVAQVALALGAGEHLKLETGLDL